MKVLLLILSLLGAAITTTSSIWGATHKLSIDKPDGKKEILLSGKLSIAFTVIGLMITFCSGIIGYRNAVREADQKATKEVLARREMEEEKRKKELDEILRENRMLLAQEFQTGILKAYNKYLINEAELEAQRRELVFTRDIILSSQPLRSLSFSWRFSGLEKSVCQSLEHLEQDATDYIDGAEDLFAGMYGKRHFETQALVRRYKQLYPFLSYLTGTQSIESGSRIPVLVVISFDEQSSAVVSFGLLAESIAASPYSGELKSYGWSGGIEYEDNFDAFEHMDLPVSTTRKSAAPYLERISKREYAISWNLDAASLFNALDFATPQAFVPAKLPDRFKIMLFYGIEKLPFEQDNLAKPLDVMPTFWSRFSEPYSHDREDIFKKQTVSLSFNGQNNGAMYDVFKTEDTDVTESFDPPETYCRVKAFVCMRRDQLKQ
jgi:hypothetical protein